MFVLKILAINLYFSTCSALSDDSENVLMSRYNFNHPPSTESYQTIPVAIVYDEPENSNRKFSGQGTNAYHPKFRTVTEQNSFDQISSTKDAGHFSGKKKEIVIQLPKSLRQSRLNTGTDFISDGGIATESTKTLLYNPEEPVSDFEKIEKSNTSYIQINLSRQRESLVTNEKGKTDWTYPYTVQKDMMVSVTAVPEEAAHLTKGDKTKKLQPVTNENNGRKRGQRVKPRIQTSRPSDDVNKTNSTLAIFKETSKKKMRERGSIKYSNYMQQPLTTSSGIQDTVPEKYYEKKSNTNVTPSLEQLKLTYNRKKTISEDINFQNNISTYYAATEVTDKSSLVEQSSADPLERNNMLTPSIGANKITTQSIRISEEENYPNIPIDRLKTKASEEGTTSQPFITTEGENHPKLPSVSVQQQNKVYKNAITAHPHIITEENNQISLVSPVIAKDINNIETLNPNLNETYYDVPKVTIMKEEKDSKSIEPLNMYITEPDVTKLNVTNSIEQDINKFKPQSFHEHGETQNINKGRVITLNSSFDVAMISPLAKSVQEQNAKLINKIEKTEIPLDVTTEIQTQEMTTPKMQIKQQQKSGNPLQNKNEAQVPVVILYDSSTPSVPASQRSGISTASIGAMLRSQPAVLAKAVTVHNSQADNKNTEERTKGRRPVIPILGSENNVYAQFGKFNYRYESGDGTNAFQEGVLKPFGDDITGEAVKGGFSYTDKDGNDFSISYTADENGYRPEGAHLPTPPPIPPAIARALAYLATKSTPAPDEVSESALDSTRYII